MIGKSVRRIHVDHNRYHDEWTVVTINGATVHVGLRAPAAANITAIDVQFVPDAAPSTVSRAGGPPPPDPVKAKRSSGAEPGGAAPSQQDSSAAATAGYSREESDRLASIRERLGKATKGEWSVIRGAREDRNGKKYGLEVATVVPQGQRPAWQSAGYVPIAEIRHPENPIRFTAHGDEASILAEREANADFIAHAPDDVAWLLQRCSPATASPAGAAPEGGDAAAVVEGKEGVIVRAARFALTVPEFRNIYPALAKLEAALSALGEGTPPTPPRGDGGAAEP